MMDYRTRFRKKSSNISTSIRTPIMERVEREQEQQITADLENQVGANARGMVGIADTAMALSKG